MAHDCEGYVPGLGSDADVVAVEPDAAGVLVELLSLAAHGLVADALVLLAPEVRVLAVAADARGEVAVARVVAAAVTAVGRKWGERTK